MPQSRRFRKLKMSKGEHTYILYYAAGQESMVAEEICRMARDPEIDLDFHDAEVLAYQLGRRSELELASLVSKTP